jgi:hypothetical protein
MKKCFQCKKKSNFNFDCKCKNLFCLNCLPFYQHNCVFNFKDEKQNILKKENEKIMKDKVQYI